MINTSHIPKELQELPQWVGWRREDRAGKPTKVPYQAGRLAKADTTDPAHRSSFSAALEAMERHKYDGIGFVLDNGWAGLDIDHCRDPRTGELAEWSTDLIRPFEGDAYMEISPSGTGVHIIGRGRVPGDRRKTAYGGGAVEMYHSGRFFTVTGNVLEVTGLVGDITDGLTTVYQTVFPAPEPKRTPAPPAAPMNCDDAQLTEVMYRASNGMKIRALADGDDSAHGGDTSKADLVFCDHLASYTQCDASRMDRMFRNSGRMRPKWDERRGTSTWGERTIQKAIERCAWMYDPSRTETYNLGHNSHTPKPQLAVWSPDITNDEEDPLERLARLEAALAEERAQRIRLEAEVQRLRAENQRMKERHDWEVQLDKVPNKHLKASEKQVARDLLRQSYYWRDKGLEGPQPVLISTVRNKYGVALGRTEFTGLSPDTYSKGLQALHETGTIVRDVVIDPNNGHKRVMVSLTDKFFREPAAIRKSQESNHGGKRCPECGSTRIKAIRWACEDCGVAFDRPAEAVTESPPEAEASMQEWEELYQRAENNNRVAAPPKPQDAGYRGVEAIPYAADDGLGGLHCTFTPFGCECPHPDRCSERGRCSP